MKRIPLKGESDWGYCFNCGKKHDRAISIAAPGSFASSLCADCLIIFLK